MNKHYVDINGDTFWGQVVPCPQMTHIPINGADI